MAHERHTLIGLPLVAQEVEVALLVMVVGKVGGGD